MKSYEVLAVFHALSNYYAGSPSSNAAQIPNIRDTFLKSLLKNLNGTSVVFVWDLQENLGSNELLSILLGSSTYCVYFIFGELSPPHSSHVISRNLLATPPPHTLTQLWLHNHFDKFKNIYFEYWLLYHFDKLKNIYYEYSGTIQFNNIDCLLVFL